MTKECIYCDTPLTPENISKEHVIQNALGGLLESTNICCDKCNNSIEKIVDNQFCSIFSPIISQLPSLKKTNKTELPSYKGLAIYIEDGNVYNVILKNNKVIDCKEAKQKYRRNFTKKDYEKFEVQSFRFEMDNERFSNGMGKIAVNFALSKEIPFENIKNTIQVRKEFDEITKVKFLMPIIPFMPRNSFDSFIELETSYEPYHSLILFSEGNLLICYIDLFNTFQFYVILSENWTGGEIYKTYLQLVSKIDRTIPKFVINRTKDIYNLAQIYKIAPSLDIEQFKRQIKTTINKKPYEQELESYLATKITFQYSNDPNNSMLLESLRSLQFYLDEDEVIRKKRFRIWTLVFSNDTFEKKLYPIYLIELYSNGLDVSEYSFKKFRRLSDFLMNRINE